VELCGALTARYHANTFVFEAPFESQQSVLNAEFGQRVNLAEIRSGPITSIESQRGGFLSKSVFGISYLRKDPEGGPTAKFMCYIIKTKYPIDRTELANIRRTGCNRGIEKTGANN
jgi:phosphosulfolactate synthase